MFLNAVAALFAFLHVAKNLNDPPTTRRPSACRGPRLLHPSTISFRPTGAICVAVGRNSEFRIAPVSD